MRVGMGRFLRIAALVLCIAAWGQVWAAGSGQDAPVASGAKLEGNQPFDINKNPGSVLSDPKYKDCGMSCIYGKASENLSLQYLYMGKKMDFLDSHVDPATNPAQADMVRQKEAELNAKKFEVLGDFCNAAEKQSSDPSSCIERYKRHTDLWLGKVRIGMAMAEQARADLECADRDPSGKCRQGKNVDYIRKELGLDGRPIDANKLGQTPYFSKSSELGLFSPGRAPTVRSNDEWKTNMENQLEPKPTDYVKFKTIPRNPDDPSAGNFTIPVKKPDGTLELDNEAYQAALAAWKGIKAGNEIANIYAGKLKADGSQMQIQDILDQNLAEFRRDFTGEKTGDQRSALRKIYDDARAEYINHINNTSGQARGAGQSPQASASGTPRNYDNPGVNSTGNEVVKDPPASDHTSERLVRYRADKVDFYDPQLATPERRAEYQQMMNQRGALSNGLGGQVTPPPSAPPPLHQAPSVHDRRLTGPSEVQGAASPGGFIQ